MVNCENGLRFKFEEIGSVSQGLKKTFVQLSALLGPRHFCYLDSDKLQKVGLSIIDFRYLQ